MGDSIIQVNPLNGFISKGVRPQWMCKHARAELLDKHQMLYACNECNSSNGIVRVLPRVTTGQTSPKKVSISPKKEQEGFQ
jgi:hypothetical protein